MIKSPAVDCSARGRRTDPARRRRPRQRGVALITVLLIVALLTAAAVRRRKIPGTARSRGSRGGLE